MLFKKGFELGNKLRVRADDDGPPGDGRGGIVFLHRVNRTRLTVQL